MIPSGTKYITFISNDIMNNTGIEPKTTLLCVVFSVNNHTTVVCKKHSGLGFPIMMYLRS